MAEKKEEKEIIYPKVTLRGFGKYYGLEIKAELIAMQGYNVVKVRYHLQGVSQPIIAEFLCDSGFEINHFDENTMEEYSGYQLQIEDLVFDKSIPNDLEAETEESDF